jgi:hypothetical protein
MELVAVAAGVQHASSQQASSASPAIDGAAADVGEQPLSAAPASVVMQQLSTAAGSPKPTGAQQSSLSPRHRAVHSLTAIAEMAKAAIGSRIAAPAPA